MDQLSRGTIFIQPSQSSVETSSDNYSHPGSLTSSSSSSCGTTHDIDLVENDVFDTDGTDNSTSSHDSEDTHEFTDTSTESSKQEFSQQVLKSTMFSDCMAMMKNLTRKNRMKFDEAIGIDCDAFSFIITINNSMQGSCTMEPHIESAVKNFLLHFGQEVSDAEIPTRPYASKRKDSIFGTTDNFCQHLDSSSCGEVLTKNEVLVVTSPVKIAVQAQCKKKILQHLKTHHPHYYFEPATNANICINTKEVGNVPSYGRMIEAILKSCYVDQLDKFVLHVANFGKRHNLDHEGSDQCSFQHMFDLVQQMRDIDGITVELIQMDVAFSLKSAKGELVTWSYVPKKGRNHQKVSVLRDASVNIFALHSIANKDNKVAPDGQQAGTVQVKHKKKWSDSVESYVHEHYQDHSENEEEEAEYNPYWGDALSACHQDTKISYTTVHSIKAYSTVSHMFPKSTKTKPVSVSAMNQFHKSSFRQLQNFLTHMQQSAHRAASNINDVGICGRLEVSIRPNNGEIARKLRYSGDLSDVILHVHVGLNDLLVNSHRKLCIILSNVEPVRAKIDYMIDKITPMVKLRASNCFCDLYKNAKIHDWLRAISNMIMILVGVAPDFNLKYVKSWMNDLSRYDPTNEAKFITSQFLHVSSDSPLPPPQRLPEIPKSQKIIISKSLQDVGISNDGISKIIEFVDRNDSESGRRKSFQCFQALSLQDKLTFVEKSHAEIIPDILTKIKTNQMESNHQEDAPNEINEHGEDHELLDIFSWRQFDLQQSHQFLDSALKLSQGVSNQYRRIHNPQNQLSYDSITNIVRLLDDLSQYGDLTQPVFVPRLYHHILHCHNKQISMRGGRALPPLTSTDGHVDQYLQEAGCLLAGNNSSLQSLKQICKALCVSTTGPNQKVHFISKLSAHYYFPCCHPPSTWASFQAIPKDPDTVELINQIVNETCDTNIVIQLQNHNTKQNHYYRACEDEHVYICPKEYLATEEYFPCHEQEVDDDIYCFLDKCFLPNSSSDGYDGYESRLRIDIYLTGLTCLKDNFISEDGTNNPHFGNSIDLIELQEQKQFLISARNGPLQAYLKMCPEIIFPVTTHMYQTNILFIDNTTNTTNLHIYNESLCKVVTYSFPGTNWCPQIKCKIIAQKQSSFQHIISELHNHNINPQEYRSLVFPRPIHNPTESTLTKVSSFKNHPQGSYTQHRSGQIVKSILCLLTSTRISHKHFTTLQETHPHDPLDLKPYLNELCYFYEQYPLSKIFEHKIISNWTQCYPTTIHDSSTFADFHTEIVPINWSCAPFQLVFPIMCLKYKLWLSLWEQDGGKNTSYFYYFDPISNKVIMEEFPSFIYKVGESHILYFKQSKSLSGSISTGCWPGEPHNPFTSIETTFSPGMIIATDYSYLDGHLRDEILKIFRDKIGIHFKEKEDLKHPIATPGKSKPTFYIHDLHHDSSLMEHSLFIYYPFSPKTKKYHVVVVHGVSPTIINNEVNILHQNLTPDVQNQYLCMQFDTRPKLYFASLVPMMLFIYVAQFTDTPDMLISILHDLHIMELDVIKKTKDWLSHMADNIGSATNPPAWLSMLCKSHGCDVHIQHKPTKDKMPPNHSLIPTNSPLAHHPLRVPTNPLLQPNQLLSSSIPPWPLILPSKLTRGPISSHYNSNYTKEGHVIINNPSATLPSGSTLPNPNPPICHNLRTQSQKKSPTPLVHSSVTPTAISLPGIKNIGNSCYIAASLHLLFGSPHWIELLYAAYAECYLSRYFGKSMLPLTRSFLEIAVFIGVLKKEDALCIGPNHARDHSTQAANPSLLKQHLDLCTQDFKGYVSSLVCN